MSQPSVACYFTNRKRPAIDEIKLDRAKKCLRLDEDSGSEVEQHPTLTPKSDAHSRICEVKKLVTALNIQNNAAKRTVKIPKPRQPSKEDGQQKDIKELFGQMAQRKEVQRAPRSPPTTPTKQTTSNDVNQIKKKLSRSERLAELKAASTRLIASAERLKKADERIAHAAQEQPKSPQIKGFKTIEIELPVSPQKAQSPEKPYLSPKKDTSARRNLLSSLSPTKNHVSLFADSPSKQILEESLRPALTLPYKYLCLLEMFSSIDIVVQILHNRNEKITFNKLKPGVEKMSKRNLLEQHLAQIKTVYPESYKYVVEKLKQFGSGTREHEWELVVIPSVDTYDKMTETLIVGRKKTFGKLLLDRTKTYHDEFLKTLIPPLIIAKDQVTRWHPEFNLDEVPDIEPAEIPKPPVEQVLTGQQVLEKAREMFSCNTRMEQALAKLRQTQANNPGDQAEETTKPAQPQSLLKGIPKGLLEKVRQKQAAKALVSMTRSADKDKEIQMYSRLPEIARITRNLFVGEKKSVLLLETVIDKLANSYESYLAKSEMDKHLRAIHKELPQWLTFISLRNSMYVKLAKDADLSSVLDRLERIAKQKNET